MTMTKRELFTNLLAIEEISANPDFKTGLEHEIALLDAKNVKAKGRVSKNQKANDELRGIIMAYLLVADAPKSIADLTADVAELSELSASKIAHLMKPLIDTGRVAKVKVKNIVHYSAVVEDPDSASAE